MLAMAGRHHKPVVGYDGRFKLGERDVPDPFPTRPGDKITAQFNVRESAIAHMASRGRLNSAQVLAGEKFRKLCELVAIGRQRTTDFECQGHSPGYVGDPITDELVRAGHQLDAALRSLGPAYSRILMAIVGEGNLIEDVARRWTSAGGVVSGRRAEGYVTGTLIDAIDELVRIWKLEAIGLAKQAEAYYERNGEKIAVTDDIRASGPMNYTGPARQINIGKFGDVEVEERRGIDRGTLTVHVSGNVPTAAPRKHR